MNGRNGRLAALLVVFGSCGPGAVFAAEETFDCSKAGHLWEDATREELRDAKLHYRSTRLYFSQQNYVSAVREAELAVHLDQTQPAYYMQLGMAYAALECFVPAGNAFARARALAEKDPGAEKLLADIKQNQSFYWQNEAIEGNDHYQKQDFPKAAESFRNAIALDSTSVSAWRNLGAVLSSMQDPTGALRAVEKAYSLDPGDVETQARLRTQLEITGRIAARSGQAKAASDSTRTEGLAEMTNAVEHFKRAIDLNAPEDEIALYAQDAGLTSWQRARLEEPVDSARAMASYASAIDWFHQAEVNRVRAAAAGKVETGVSEAEAAQNYVKSVLRCYASMDEPDSTLAYATRMIDLDPKWRDGYQFVAAALRSLGKSSDALRYLIMWQCLETSVKPVSDVSAHMAGLLSRYKPTDEIVSYSMTAQEPEEIRVYTEGDQYYEAWISWTKGQGLTFVNGKKIGVVSFKPLSASAAAEASALGQTTK